jgi:putative colanic acid biosynthesis UDP-glucose lipid carrier transferase
MENRYVFLLIASLAILDAIAINGSYFSLYYLDIINRSELNFFTGSYFLIGLNLAWLIAAVFNRLYAYNNVQTIKTILKKSLHTFLGQIIILMVFSIVTAKFEVVSEYVAFIFLAELLVFALIRATLHLIETNYLNFNNFQKKIAIIGSNDLGIRLEKYFLQNKLSFNFKGAFEDIEDDSNVNALINLKHSIKFAIENQLDEVYTTLFPETCKGLNEVIELAEQNCVRVKFVTTFVEYHNHETDFTFSNYKLVNYYDGIPILVSRKEPLESIFNRIIKRAFDIAFSLFVIIFLLSWLLPIMMILIRIESPGDTIFTQLRSGKNNKPFLCFKFRSMRLNQDCNKAQATRNDSRITKVGAFMRKTSIDELPQFFNVLFGNMSVVGPRPHMLKHTEEYRKIIDQYMVRHYLKPGITGWAQINGHRGETKERQQMVNRVKHDVWYMENWSLAKDIEIIYKTAANVVKGEKNAF